MEVLSCTTVAHVHVLYDGAFHVDVARTSQVTTRITGFIHIFYDEEGVRRLSLPPHTHTVHSCNRGFTMNTTESNPRQILESPNNYQR